MKKLELFVENIILASRWLLVAFYIGLGIALAFYAVTFFVKLWDFGTKLFTLDETATNLKVLGLIDAALIASLVVMVIISGYENFVSKIELAPGTDRPSWMGSVDFSGLKMKLIASIVAISAIHLLKKFMEIGKGGLPINEPELFWLAAIHVVFVLSGLLMAAMDWLVAKSSGKKSY